MESHSLSLNPSTVRTAVSSKIIRFSNSIVFLPKYRGTYHATSATGTRLSMRTGSNSADDSNSGVDTA